MPKKHQVFVSSTYRDLREERALVMQALLEMKCIPVGMELFPAADIEQLTYIRQEIAESDYYIVIVGGKYGSIDTDSGLSFTELELKIARELNIPCIAFFFEDIDSLPVEKRETDPHRIEKLKAFRDNVLRRLGKSWSDGMDLSGKVSRSISHLMQTRPSPGWIKNEALPDRSPFISEFTALVSEIRGLKEKFELPLSQPVPSHTLVPVSDPVKPRTLFTFRGKLMGKDPFIVGVLPTNGRRLFVRAIGPSLSQFGVPGAVPDPEIRIFCGADLVAVGEPWGRISGKRKGPINALAQSLGVSKLLEGSSDAVVLIDDAKGAYTILVGSIGNYTGSVIIEAYEG